MTARTALLLALAAAAAPSGQRDRADPPAAWHATASDGVAAQVSGVATAGGKALRLAYDFGAVSGYAVARRSLPIDWPDNYVIRLRLRGRGGVNDLQLKFVDASGANVWWVQRRAVRPSPDWQDIVIRPRDVTFAWGPSADHRLRHTAAIELVVVRGRDGGAGHVDLDALTLTPLPPARPLAAPVASEPAVLDGRTDTAWRTRGGGALVFDFGGMREVGGLLLHWQPGAGASRYVVEASDDRRHWRVVRRVTRGDGGDDPVTLADVETRYLRLTLPADAPPAALGEAVVEPREWSATPNDLVAALAHAEPRGTFPRGFSGEQPYWTLVGTDGGADSGLLGEDGAIEVARGGFSIEPFVVERRHRFDWAGVATHQSLERGYLPLPHVGWTAPGWTLDSAVFADATAPRLLARWRLANTGAAPRTLRLVLAVRPFQVNPPAQFLGLPGGVSPIAAIRWARDRLVVTTPPAIDGDPAVDRVLRPLDPPTAVATAPFDAGGLARPATLDGPEATTDPQHLASAALSWTVTLAPGERRDVATDPSDDACPQESSGSSTRVLIMYSTGGMEKHPMNPIVRVALLLVGSSLAVATPVLAQSQADEARFQQAQQRFDNEWRLFRAEYDRYQQSRLRGYPPPRPVYEDSRYVDPAYDNRDEGNYDPSRYYRNDPRYQERVLGPDDRVYAGTDGRYYCKRNDGTTGLIAGAVGGGVLGNLIDGGHSRGVGTILGAIAGGVVGKSVDQNNAQVRCR